MQDWYQMPALVLTALLVPAFANLYRRNHDIRNLLWFLAFLFVLARMLLLYPTATWDIVDSNRPWVAAAGQSCAMIAAALFLGSLSPLSFSLGRVRVLYAVPFTAPLVAYAILSHGLFHLRQPTGAWFFVFPAMGAISIVAGLLWALAKGALPPWLGTLACLGFGGLALTVYFRHGLYWPLVLAESGLHVLMALLLVSVFRRASPGVILSSLAFLVWAGPILFLFPFFHEPALNLFSMRFILMAKVAAALGLLLVALENELATNRAAGDRESRARQEVEAYAKLEISGRRVEDLDRLAGAICTAIVQHSRFAQAAILLAQPSGTFRLTGSAGLDGAVIRGLDAVASRIPRDAFDPSAHTRAAEGSQTLRVELEPWLIPGDDLRRLRFTWAYAIPLNGRSEVEGAFLLCGLRDSGTLRADELAPLELLASRLQAVRAQTRMLEKLVDAEKFAGLGQLASSVTQQLNNPLTVVLGYASLLEAAPLDAQSRRGVEAILNSARGMRDTLESLLRVAMSPAGHLAAASLTELLEDIHRLYRPEFLQRGMEFRFRIADDLPRVLCQPQQIRQAVLHGLQFAIQAVEAAERNGERAVRLEAASEGGRVRIVIAHTGREFAHPDRAFDPFASPEYGNETTALGLGLCASILRDNQGRATAENLQPRGAAIILELNALESGAQRAGALNYSGPVA